MRFPCFPCKHDRRYTRYRNRPASLENNRDVHTHWNPRSFKLHRASTLVSHLNDPYIVVSTIISSISAWWSASSYIRFPPMIQTVSVAARAMASDIDETTHTLGSTSVELTTMMWRPGSGCRPNESHVRRPITTVSPRVHSRNHRRSPGTSHGIPPFSPMPPSGVAATMSRRNILLT